MSIPSFPVPSSGREPVRDGRTPPPGQGSLSVCLPPRPSTPRTLPLRSTATPASGSPPPRLPRSQSARPRSAAPRPAPGAQPGRPSPPPGRAQELRRPRGARPAAPRRGRAGAAGAQGRWAAGKPPAGQPAGDCGARAAGRLAETCPGPRAPGIAPITSATTKPANVMVPVPPAWVHLPFSSRPGCEEGRRGRGVPLIPLAAHPCPPPPAARPAGAGRAGLGEAQPRRCRLPTCRSLPSAPGSGAERPPEHGHGPSGNPGGVCRGMRPRSRPRGSLPLPRQPRGYHPSPLPASLRVLLCPRSHRRLTPPLALGLP